MRDDVDPRRVDPRLAGQPPRAVLGVHDHRVHARVEPPLAGALQRGGLAREHVVGGEHARADAREQQRVEHLDGEPLPVDGVHPAGGAAIADEVRAMAGPASRPSRRTREPGRPRDPPVERLRDRVRADRGGSAPAAVRRGSRPRLRARAPRTGRGRRGGV